MSIDDVDQSYYPSARVRLLIRFEDFDHPKLVKPPTLPAHLRKGAGKSKDAKLTVSYVNGQWTLLGEGSSPNRVGSPVQQISSADGFTHVLDGIIPMRAVHRRNGMRTAETLSLTLPFQDLPLDPRCIRSVAVQYFLGCVTADDYQAGILGETRTDGVSGKPGLPRHVIPDAYVDAYGRQRTNLRFEGWIDDLEDLFPENDALSVQIECTDNTRLLLDQDAPPQLTVEMSLPIDQAIANYLANFPQFQGLSVAYRPEVDKSKIPKLSTALHKTAYPPKQGPPPGGGGTGPGGQGGASKTKVWDYLTDVCGMVGHNIRMIGSTIVVQRPRTLYDRRFSGRDDDPFTGRILPSGLTLNRRLYVYGKNLKELKIKRKFTTAVPRNVQISAYDPSKKRMLIVRYPSKDKRLSKPIPGDANEQTWWNITRPEIRDEKTALLVAQSVYESQGRGELVVRFITNNLASFGGGNLDPDALDLMPGDAVDVEMTKTPAASSESTTLGDIQAAMRDRPAEYLRNLGYSEGFAAAYAKALSSIGLVSTFRVKTVGTDWDMESSGVTIDVEAMNYIEIRNDQDVAAEDQITPKDVQDAAATGAGPVRVVVDEGV